MFHKDFKEFIELLNKNRVEFLAEFEAKADKLLLALLRNAPAGAYTPHAPPLRCLEQH